MSGGAFRFIDTNRRPFTHITVCVIFADKEDKVSNGAFRFVYTNRGPFTCVTVCMRHFLWQGKQSVRWGILIYWYWQKALHLCNCLYALPSDMTDKMSGEAFWFIDTNRGPFTHVTVCMSLSLTRKTKCQVGHSDLLIPTEGTVCEL